MRLAVPEKVVAVLAGGSGGAGNTRATVFPRAAGDLEDRLEQGKLVEKFRRIERDERCVQHVVLRMAGFTALAVAGLGYGLILEDDFAVGSGFVPRLMCEIALASLFGLLGVVSLWLVYRGRLKGLTRECGRLPTGLLQLPAVFPANPPFQGRQELSVSRGTSPRVDTTVSGGRTGVYS